MSEMITGLDPLPSNPNVLRVRVDGVIVARLGRTDVEALELEVGQRWTARCAARVEHAVKAAKARKAALAMLGRRAFSRGELVQRLQTKGHDTMIVSAVAEQLESDGWIDDRAYAHMIAREVQCKKPASAELLIQKVTARKVDHVVAQEVVMQITAESDPLEEAVQFATKRLRSMQTLPRSTAARRIAGALARRGFDEETVQAVIEQLKIVPEE